MFYDITASPSDRSVDRGWVSKVAAVLDIPFCVAGGIRSIGDAEEVLNKGADKVSINTPALLRPELVTELAQRFGSQCVVVGIDSREENGEYRVHQFTGDVEKTMAASRNTGDWISEVQDRGAGEIVLNCMNQDGVRKGYDVAQLLGMRQRCTVPLIASGGAGEMQHFAEVFEKASVDGALAASVFHSAEIPIPALKQYLAARHISIRP